MSEILISIGARTSLNVILISTPGMRGAGNRLPGGGVASLLLPVSDTLVS
jgi:hypothetical protein